MRPAAKIKHPGTGPGRYPSGYLVPYQSNTVQLFSRYSLFLIVLHNATSFNACQWQPFSIDAKCWQDDKICPTSPIACITASCSSLPGTLTSS